MTTDERLRAAHRGADPERLAAERARAGLCPGCGTAERHATLTRAAGTSRAFPDEVAPGDGAWHYGVGWATPGSRADVGRTPVLVVRDPCGRAVTWGADAPTRATRLDSKAEACLPGAGRAFSARAARAAEGRAWLRAQHADALAPLEEWLRARGCDANRRGEAVEVAHHAHNPNAPEPSDEHGVTILVADGYFVADESGLLVTCSTRPALLRELGYLGFAPHTAGDS